jgi:hypothetical protein
MTVVLVGLMGVRLGVVNPLLFGISACGLDPVLRRAFRIANSKSRALFSAVLGLVFLILSFFVDKQWLGFSSAL